MTLAADHLDFGYRGRPVGRDVSLSVKAGEILCLLGPNGGGKTTLFKTLLGLLPAQGGRIRLDGEELSAWPRQRLARHVAYVPQAHSAFFPFTVGEIVLMGRTPHIPAFSTPGRADRAAAEAAMAALEIAHLADRLYTEVSGGERQLALVARALAQEPRLMIMDEPTANLDFGNQVRLLERIRALASTGITIVLSTHDPDHALACADRVALLSEGRLLAIGPPEETVTAETLKALYRVDVVVTYLPELGRRVCTPSLSTRQKGNPS